MTAPSTDTVALGSDLEITVTESGAGRPALILHGGGGPFTVAGIAGHLAETMHPIVPTHPGWNGTDRPEWFTGIDDLALTYLQYLEDRDLRNVLALGPSMGGAIGSELAWPVATRRATRIILSNAVRLR